MWPLLLALLGTALADVSTVSSTVTTDPALIVLVVLILVGCTTMVGFGIYMALPERVTHFHSDAL
jgi:hypothetical protein